MFRPLLLFAMLPVGGFIASATGAENEHSHGAMGGPERTAQAELGAQATFDAKGILWVVHKSAGHIAVSRSDDRGRTWSRPVFVTAEPETTDSGADARPKIALGSTGEIYVSWTRPLSKPYTGEIRFSRSIDGGKSFAPPFVVHQDKQEITHRFDSIAVTAKGQVIVAWIDKRDGVTAAAAKAPPYRGAAVYFATSSDRGATFGGDVKLADHSCECCRIALLCPTDGSVTAMWRHVFEPNIRDHAAAKISPEGKVGEVRRVTFEDWRIDACPHHGPALAEDAGGVLHAVWFSGAPDNVGVYYGRLRANGVDGKRRVGGDAASHADLAVNENRVAIAWKEFDGERTRLHGMMSRDGGEHWQEYDLASTAGASDYPRVLFHRDQFFVFWNTRENPLSLTSFP